MQTSHHRAPHGTLASNASGLAHKHVAQNLQAGISSFYADMSLGLRFGPFLICTPASKTHQELVIAAIQQTAKDGTSQDPPNLMQPTWQKALVVPSLKWKYRNDERNPKATDTRQVTTGEDLSIDSESALAPDKCNSLQAPNPALGCARSTTETICASGLAQSSSPPGVLSSMDRESSIERLWQDYFTDPSKWWDNRSNKRNRDSPDFRHKTTKEVLCIHNWGTPEWVKKALEKETPNASAGFSSQRGTSSDRQGRTGNTANKKLRQLSEVKAIQASMMKSGNEFQLFKTNMLMDMFVKCGSMIDARHVFENMPKRDVVSWNVMILGYAKQDKGAQGLELYTRMHQEGVQPSDRTFVCALKACSALAAEEKGKLVHGKYVKVGCLEKGRAIHSQVVKSGFELDIFVGNTLVDMYANLGSMEDACCVFRELPHRDVITWTAMISGYAKQEEGGLALEFYAQMHIQQVKPNAHTFACALKACSGMTAFEDGTHIDEKFVKLACLEKGRTIHSQVIESSFDSSVFVGNTLVDMYVKCGSMEDARHVFDELPYRDVVSWTTMISGYTKQDQGVLALELYAQMYAQMYQEGVQSNARTFVCALKACSGLAEGEERNQLDENFVKLGCVENGRAIHSHIVKSCFELDIFVGNTLVDMYAKCGSMEDACHVFDVLPDRDVVTWTAMIFGYVKHEESVLALEMYARMQHEGIKPNARTFICALKACSSLAALEDGNKVGGKLLKRGCLENGRAIHSQVLKSDVEADKFVGSILMDMYVKCGSMDDACHVFSMLPQRDVVSWTAMIFGYANQEEGALALELFARMHLEGVKPNSRTIVAALKACTSLAALEEGNRAHGKCLKIRCLEKGRAIHSHAVENCLELDIFAGSTLVDMYAKCGSMEDARHVFDMLRHRDMVSWTAMIFGYAEKEEGEEALKLYAQMQEQGLSADRLTFISILKACGNIAALETGKELHVQIRKAGLETNATVANTLVDMYAKCGSMVDCQQLFDALPTKNVVTWSALLAGYARLGESKLVFELFERMGQEGVQPDSLTFLSVLTACSHAGLVEKGHEYFEAMSRDYCIPPSIEHYNCMVDLLGRVGQVHEAMMMVEKMPFEPDVVVWLTVLGASRKWKNVEVGRQAFEHVIRLDNKFAAAYVLMSNIYAHAGMWEDHQKVQIMRRNAQAWKKPGQSWWTDNDGTVHKFTAGDIRHPQIEDIHMKLKYLSSTMKEDGYTPDLDCVLQEMCDGDKEDALCGHSEKLAIACALINTPQGTPIRIVKNLRVCDDCHKVTALISRIEQRNIICRDASRFHNFIDGRCSCGDYW